MFLPSIQTAASGPAKAGAAYFAGMFVLGSILGPIRILLVGPVLGEWGATLAELLVLLPISWAYCAWLLRRLAVPGTIGARLSMGAIAFALLMIAEVLLGLWLFSLGLAQLVQRMVNGAGLAGLLGQLAAAAFPLVQPRPRGRGQA